MLQLASKKIAVKKELKDLALNAKGKGSPGAAATVLASWKVNARQTGGAEKFHRAMACTRESSRRHFSRKTTKRSTAMQSSAPSRDAWKTLPSSNNIWGSL